MSLPCPSPVRLPSSALERGQMSHASAVDRRRRGQRVARAVTVVRSDAVPVAEVSGAEFRAWWSALVARRCVTREACADMFGVTFQTACNWFDGFSTPTGDKVFLAVVVWPEDFAVVELGRVA